MSSTALRGRYAAYPEYKDSGVQWLGDVPQDWGCIKLKYIADLQSNKTESGSAEKYVGMENVESWSGRYIPTADVKPEGLSNSFSCGDILFGKLRPYLAKSWIADFSGICSSEFLVLEGQQVSPRFLNYYFLTEEFIEQVDSTTYGSKMPRASWDFISLMGVPVPPVGDSEKIANFLEHETAKIDTLIKKQKQLIKLLKEKRQAVISHAVTKGLNPDAPMRDSGVEWLGKVPEHWLTTPLKLILQTRKGVAFKSVDFCDAGVRVVKASDIKQKTIRATDVFLPIEFVQHYPKAVLNTGDIILSTVGSNPEVKNSAVGQIGMVPSELNATLLNQNTVVFDPNETKILGNYLFYILQMQGYRDHLDLQAHGTANQSSLSISDMLNFNVSYPNTDEQKEIFNYVQQQQHRLDSLMSKAKKSENLLMERRTALISAAVTGKIDVRNWQASKPSKRNTEATS